MDETIQFIYREIRNHNVNIGGQVNDIFRQTKLAMQNPIIKNNFANAIVSLTENGILEERINQHFLTEHGFNEIYNQ